MRKHRAGVLLAGMAAIGLATAAPAMAQGCTGATCGVNGTVVVASALTMSLNATSFSISAAAGYAVSTGGTGTTAPPAGYMGSLPLATAPAGYAVTATVTSNNSAGY